MSAARVPPAIPAFVFDEDTKPFALDLEGQQDIASMVQCCLAAASIDRQTFLLMLGNLLSTFGGHAGRNAAAVAWLHDEAYRNQGTMPRPRRKTDIR